METPEMFRTVIDQHRLNEGNWPEAWEAGFYKQKYKKLVKSCKR